MQRTGAINPGLPSCPVLIAGQPEGTAPDGTPYIPGVNCLIQQDQATGTGPSPLNTLDPGLSVPSAPNTSATPTTPTTTPRLTAPEYTANPQLQQLEQALEQLQGRLGLSYVTWPHYYGADTGDYRMSLLADLEFGLAGFLNNEDGLGWKVVTVDGLEGKLSLNWHGEQIFEGTALAGLTPISNRTHLEADLVLHNYNTFYELEYSKPFGGFDGWTLTASAGAEIFMQTGILTARAGATHGSLDWMTSYYGITSGAPLPDYTPHAGLRDVFAEARVDLPIDSDIGIELRGSIRRVIGTARKSPLVSIEGSAMDYAAGVSFYYNL